MLTSEPEMNAGTPSATDEDGGREFGRAVRLAIRRQCGWRGSHTSLASAAASGLRLRSGSSSGPFVRGSRFSPGETEGEAECAADAGLSTAFPVALGAGRYPM